jgi:hypothetical protein
MAKRTPMQLELVDVLEEFTTRFESPNESDRNGETANVVDGLFAIARGLHAVAKAIESIKSK